MVGSGGLRRDERKTHAHWLIDWSRYHPDLLFSAAQDEKETFSFGLCD
jgi:hypothetical protein